MPKLKTIKPLVGKLPSRLTREVAEKVRLQEREQNVDWRPWYKTSRWQKLRLEVLSRDGYICQRTGILLSGKHPAPNSAVVDHKKPHRGDPDLFWDKDNLQSVSKEWHDSIKQAIEKADQVAAIHPKWLQPSIIPLTIVCGPPASGKSTYVAQHKREFDLVIDLDEIAAELSGEPLHGWDRDRWLNAALYRRNDLLGSLSRPSRHRAAWLIVSEPKARHREWWVKTMRPQSLVMLEVPEPQCLANAMRAGDRNINRVDSIITQWWAHYERRVGDTIITSSRGG